jgi:hypothetical protein
MAHRRGSAGVVMTTSARRTGPREHGPQAARSKRDRPGRAREQDNGLSQRRAAAGGVLEPLKANSTTCSVTPVADQSTVVYFIHGSVHELASTCACRGLK